MQIILVYKPEIFSDELLILKCNKTIESTPKTCSAPADACRI